MLVQGVNCSILKITRNLLSTLTFTLLSFVIFQFAEAEAEAEAAEGPWTLSLFIVFVV